MSESKERVDVVKKIKDIKFHRMNIEYLSEKQRELEARSTSIKSPNYSQVAAGSHVSNVENMMDINLIQQEEITNKLKDSLEKMERLEKEVEYYIEQLEPNEQVIIRLHYIQGETLERICGVINYCYRQTRRIHNSALTKLSQMQ